MINTFEKNRIIQNDFKSLKKSSLNILDPTLLWKHVFFCILVVTIDQTIQMIVNLKKHYNKILI